VQKDAATLIGAQGVQGDAACANIIRQADLVICVGTRLTDFTTGSRALFQHPKVQFVHINVNTADAHKLGALPMLADAREGLRALTKAARKAGIKPKPTYLKKIEKERSDWNQRMEREAFREWPGEPMNEGLLVRTVFEESKPGDSAVGYEIPGALGTRLAQRQGEIFAFVGDGTYLMNPTELVTCSQENLKITVIVAENFGFQCIRAHQMHRAGRAFGNEFRYRDNKSNRLEGDYVKVDYVKTSEGFGAKAWKANTVAELRKALRAARKEKGTCVIVVETSSERYPPGSDMWWDVGVAEVSGDPVTRKLRRQYAKEVSEHQRFYY
jgi:3D-(3,5/4)-trihydroxycyclohexane-1,2-dione acylhydrolase (decyclizing)